MTFIKQSNYMSFIRTTLSNGANEIVLINNTGLQKKIIESCLDFLRIFYIIGGAETENDFHSVMERHVF